MTVHGESGGFQGVFSVRKWNLSEENEMHRCAVWIFGDVDERISISRGIRRVYRVLMIAGDGDSGG